MILRIFQIPIRLTVLIFFEWCGQGSEKPGFFFKAQPSFFEGGLMGFGVLLGFLDKQEKIGKIIQKL